MFTPAFENYFIKISFEFENNVHDIDNSKDVPHHGIRVASSGILKLEKDNF